MPFVKVKLNNIKNVSSLLPEAQLLVAIRDESVTSIVRLYANGAKGNAVDENGNNALHLAVKTGNVYVIQAILMFYAKTHSLFSMRNKDGRRPRDLTYSVEILKCLEIMQTGKLKSVPGGNCMEKSILSDVDNYINRLAIEKKIGNDNRVNQPILLSLDGGGIRGLVLIRILMHLERKLSSPIWEVFDWVCGTSTGAILAIALSKKLSLEHVQKLYLRLKNKIFVGPRPYNSRLLETFLKEELGTEAMSNIKHPRLMATCCLTHVAPPKLKLFRNYLPENSHFSENDHRQLGYDDPNCVEMWKAARCSSAAPTYFRPFEKIYSDGGIMANNPTLELLNEFFRYQSLVSFREPSKAKEKIGCVISLGTGIPPITKITIHQTRIGNLIKTISKYGEHLKNMVTVFIKQMTASDGSVVDQSRSWCYSLGVPFFRFSPAMSFNIDLDETNDRSIIELLWETEYYMVTSAASQVRDLVKLIKGLRLISTPKATNLSASRRPLYKYGPKKSEFHL